MAKLYIFGIGGTGSRVLKALTMLFASGCKLPNQFSTVIPIIIDPDTSNGDLNRTKNILRLYQEIRNQVNDPDDFFAQEIKTINEIADNSSTINPDYFQFQLSGASTSFRDYIGFDSLSDDSAQATDDQNFIRLLYSEKNLNSNLNVGFKGNPNMGSVVLDQFTKSIDFQKFGQTFKDGDAIFIINSIFGGTGAAGFPLLLKNLKGNANLTNIAKIKDAPTACITYLPYFSLDKTGTEIDSDSFEEKAKIAIDYYNRTIINENKLNAIYFIGNNASAKVLPNNVGGAEQKNDAHFFEMVGALSILDFCKNINSFSCINGTSSNPTQVKEYGVEDGKNVLTFKELNIENQKQFSASLTKYRLFTEYLRIGLEKALNVSRWTKNDIKLVRKIHNSYLNKNYFKSAGSGYEIQIKAFNELFSEWIKEMGENQPAFAPFNEISHGDALKLVKGEEPKGDTSFKVIDRQNCLFIDNIELRPPVDKKHTTLIKLFGKTTEKVLNKRNLLIR